MLKQIVIFAAIFAYVNADCRQLTLDACGENIDPPFEQSKGLTFDLCQRFCNEIYEGVCNAFQYNTKEQTCELFATDPLEFANSCKVVGGTRDPDPEECKTSSDPCDVSNYTFQKYLVILIF